jgi:hypothetical protein
LNLSCLPGGLGQRQCRLLHCCFALQGPEKVAAHVEERVNNLVRAKAQLVVHVDMNLGVR